MHKIIINIVVQFVGYLHNVDMFNAWMMEGIKIMVFEL